MKSFKLLSLLLVSGLFVQVGFGQYTFSIVGQPDPAVIDGNVLSISASGRIEFNDTDDTVTVRIKNTGTSPSSITGFFILRATDVSYEDDEGALSANYHYNTGNPTDTSNPLDPTWTYAPTMTGGDADGLQNFDYDGSGRWPGLDYFGARSGERLDYTSSGSDEAVFVFSFDELDFSDSTISAWASAQEPPHIFMRWQAIGYYDEDGNKTGDASGKGYIVGSDDPNWEPAVVPEPSEVALLSILGLGGLLWTRKRFMKKA